MTLIKWVREILMRQTTDQTKNNFSFEKTHQVSNLTDTLTEEPTDDIDVSSVFRLVVVFGILADFLFSEIVEKG